MLTGIVVQVTPHEIVVDVGAKSEGVISGKELERVPKDVLAELKVGDEVVLFGDQGEAALSLEEVARGSETLAYEIMCTIGKRVTGLTVVTAGGGRLPAWLAIVRAFLYVIFRKALSHVHSGKPEATGERKCKAQPELEPSE